MRDSFTLYDPGVAAIVSPAGARPREEGAYDSDGSDATAFLACHGAEWQDRANVSGYEVTMRMFAAVLSLLVVHGGASARECGDPCLEAERQSSIECRQNAVETQSVSRTLCRGRDLACAQACVVGEQDCVAATGLGPALAACASEGEAAIQRCLNRFAAGTKRRSQCIDDAQLSTFQCRNGARVSRRGQLARCAVLFRGCVRPCGPDARPPGVRRCLAEAARTKRSAVATCNQTANTARSACFDKDATCVQSCRDTRTTCGQPTQATLAAALESCENTRRTAGATCEATTPVGSERQACIQIADANAFVCRDDAREAAAPGLTACEKAYVPCVRSCPQA